MKKDDLAANNIIQTDTLSIKTRKELENNQQTSAMNFFMNFVSLSYCLCHHSLYDC